jgi:hypothetical protein
MTWANPLAFLGLVLAGIPVLIHLLTRRRTVAQPFPTLRFIPPSSVVTSRRHRLSATGERREGPTVEPEMHRSARRAREQEAREVNQLVQEHGGEQDGEDERQP